MKTLGLLPMVLSRDEAASMWRSLGLTVLCGTITGTMLTLLIIPTAYYLMENPRKSFYGFLGNMKFLLVLFNKINAGESLKKIKEKTLKKLPGKADIPVAPDINVGNRNLPKIPKIKL
jgi:hypothetical protein